MTSLNVSRTLLLWALAAGGLSTAIHGPTPLILPSLALGAASGMVAFEQTKKISLKELALEFWDLGLCLGTLDADSSTAPTEVPPWRIEKLPASVKDWLVVSHVDPTTPEFWTEKRARGSKIYVGARGSGKSFLVNFQLSQMAAAGIDLKIADRHYPNGDFDWLPGVDRGVFESRYLLRSEGDTYHALMSLKQTLHNRIEGIEVNRIPKHLVIDEWCGLLRKWDQAQIQNAVAAVSFIFDEGRKFGIDVSLVTHGLTEKKTALDASITGTADLYLMGDALSQTTYTYPASLSQERPRLMQERAGQVAQVSTQQRVLVFRDGVSGEASVVVAPDLSVVQPLEIATSIEDWVAQHLDQITAYKAQGLSIRAITDRLKVKRNAGNPQYEALKEVYENIVIPLEVTHA